jgi:peroxiredoxin
MTPAKTPQRGTLAPDFDLVDATGQPRRLSDLTSQSALVLLFYRGYW